jgi:glycosyltransferase involved in cell wall biosynthesis
MIRDLISNGFQVHVAAPDLEEDCATAAELKQIGAITHNIFLDRNGNNPFRDLLCLLSLTKLMRVIRPTYVLPYTIKAVIYGNLAARICKIEHRSALITGLGSALGSGEGLKAKLLVYLHKMAFKNLNCAIFQNNDDRVFFKENKILAPNTYSEVVNGSGINLSRFCETPPPTNSVSFLLIARLLHAKGIREFAETALALKPKHPNAEFKVVGWREDSGEFISEYDIEKWEKTGAIQFLGELSDVRPELNTCSVMVLPSYYPEGLPRTLLEALATGRAIVTTETPGCRETVTHGKNGYLIPPKSRQALSDACEEFLLDPDKIVTFGKYSRSLASERFDVAKVNADIIRIISKGQEV